MIVFSATSCRKEQVTIQNSELSGNWQWTGSSGGFQGELILADSVDYYQSIYVGTEGTFRWSKNGVLIKQAHYTLDYEDTMYGHSLPTLHFDSADIPLTITYLKNDSLQLAENCYDCYFHGFVRSKTMK